MYSQYFGLRQDPFSIAPDPHYLFMSERHREALAHLLYGVGGHGTSPSRGAGGGFVLLTGDIGAGKTTICRCFLEQVPAQCQVAYIFNPKLTVIELLQTVCEEFHIRVGTATGAGPTLKNHIDALNAFLLQSHAVGRNCVLIIDEAQNLQPDVLEQLRLLTNLETNARKLLQIVLIGQPELRAMLERPELEQLAQRVIARFHLSALSEAETAQYIAHRMAVAGLVGPLPFDRQGLRHIHRLAGGVPRRINLLCGRALLGAWAHGVRQVGASVVNRAAAEVFGTGSAVAMRPGPRFSNYLVGGACLLVGAAGAWWATAQWPTPNPVPPAPSVLSAPAPVPAVAPTVQPPEPPEPPASAPGATENLDALLAQWPTDINSAWSALAPSWQMPADAENPCDAAAARQLQCLRVGQLTVPLLRQLGRPGIVGLQADSGPPVYAELVELDEHTATLRAGTQLHKVRLTALGHLWNGDFATYWHPPPGYSPQGPASSAPALFLHLAQQLAKLDGAPLPTTTTALDAALKERVRDFQRAHGLQADGLPGPLTFMQIESALGRPGGN
jgi:general secretion pathway protein A